MMDDEILQTNYISEPVHQISLPFSHMTKAVNVYHKCERMHILRNVNGLLFCAL